MKNALIALRDWVDARFPLMDLWNEHLAKYYAPKNFNFWYFFGSLALVVLVLQILTGIWLAMYYKPDADLAFGSVEFIMRDVNWGWLIRYLHSAGASFFFLVVYLHMFRGLLYGSFKRPRELIWILGMLIYGTLMAEAFMGYLLPWGQMSYWGAQVITSLFGALPFGIGEPLMQWIRGDYAVSDATLNRFFSLHVVALPILLLGLVVLHIMALHEVGSNNPDGVEIKGHKDANGVPLDGIPFHPYYTVKDLMGVMVFLFVFAIVVFFMPEVGGWFLEKDNFIPANPRVTPEEIRPLWYFTPYYAILRAIPQKLTGVLALAASIVILFLLPWLDRNPIKSIRYRSLLFKGLVMVFVATFLVLGYLGTQRPEPALAELGLRLGELYFSFFLMLWVYSKERSASFYWSTFVVLLFIIAALDAVRFEPGRGGLMMTGAVIPVLYYIVFLLGPVFTRWNESLPVPERVRAK
jgi:ubiquinol-cytochrome c reductase cytochrome b subunit